MARAREDPSGTESSDATVFIVDPDQHIRSSMTVLLEESGITALTFASAEEFFAAANPRPPACIVTEVGLPGISGLDLQQEMLERSSSIPVIFIVGHSDIPTAVRAVRKGAIDFLEKPFGGQVLLSRIERALVLSAGRATRGH